MRFPKFILAIVVLCVFICLFGCGDDETVNLGGKNTSTMKTAKDVAELRQKAWLEVSAEEKKDKKRVLEIRDKKIDFGEVSMKYELTVKGEPDPNGYPCYIALHGGGESDTPDINNQQWEHMQIYYLDSVENGVYVAPRGVRDTCDCHSNPESFPCYERLLENLFLYYNVDPNRVYMLGYSAGGDGTVLVTPVLADRFAAANSSASYTAERNYTNLYNMPIQIQGGENDSAYNRNILLAQCVTIFEDLKKEYGGGYESRFYMHFAKGHSFVDRDPERTEQPIVADPVLWLNESNRDFAMANTNAVDFLDQYVRYPYPRKIVWDLGYRQPLQEVESFYWLKADKDANSGIVVFSMDKTENLITVERLDTDKPITVLLNEEMLDLFKPITVDVLGTKYKITVDLSEELIYETLRERLDPNYSFCASITVTKDGVK